MSSEMDYKGIKERVEQRVRKEKNLSKFILFAVNVALFLVFTIFAWRTYIASGGSLPTLEQMTNIPGVPKPAMDPVMSILLMMSVGWAVALLLQAVGFIIDTPIGERSIRDRAMGREMRKEMARLGLDDLEAQEKRKGMMRLTDDGELEALDDVSELEAVPIQQNRKG
jgi:hypothetical protein